MSRSTATSRGAGRTVGRQQTCRRVMHTAGRRHWLCTCAPACTPGLPVPGCAPSQELAWSRRRLGGMATPRVTRMVSNAELDRHPLHLARWAAALCAALSGAGSAASAGGVPGGPYAQRPRLPRSRRRAGPAGRDRARRLLPRLSWTRALAVRTELEELLDPGRA